jgi:EmrB/QacA subfamily drug resistance transporter
VSPRPGRAAHPRLLLLALSMAALGWSLGQTMVLPAFPALTTALDTDAAGVAWTLTGYLVPAAILTPVIGRLGDMLGRDRVLVAVLLVLVAGNVACALAPTLELVVAGRVVQGVAGGIFPLCFAILREHLPARMASSGIGTISALVGVGGGAGLVLGGVLIDRTSYHGIFWAGALIALVGAAAVRLVVPRSAPGPRERIDVRGIVVLSIGLLLPLVAISRANAWGWTSAATLGLIAAGGIVLGLWVRLQLRTAEPLADIAALRAPPVLMTNAATLLVGFGIFGSFVLTPQLAQAPESTGYGVGLDATGAGLVMLPGSLAMLLAGPASGALGSRAGNKVSLVIGAVIAAAGLGLMAVEHQSIPAILGFSAMLSAGVGFCFAAMPNLVLEAVPEHRTGEATGFNALVRQVGSSLGTQVTAAVLAGTIVVAGGAPTDVGYTTAFAVGAAGALLAACVAALIPVVHLDSAPARPRWSRGRSPAMLEPCAARSSTTSTTTSASPSADS